MPTTAVSIMDRLKAATRELHQRAETHPFQKAFVRGYLPLESYKRYLGQMYLVHHNLEGHLCRLTREVLQFGAVIEEYQYQEPRLVRDLVFFAVDPAGVGALSATRVLLAAFDDAMVLQPFALLGCHYVLEGSNNGSKFIARAVRGAYGLSASDGANYLDPYGHDQSARWTAFKQKMNAAHFSQAQATQLIEGAVLMFQGIIRICDDLILEHPLMPIEADPGIAQVTAAHRVHVGRERILPAT